MVKVPGVEENSGKQLFCLTLHPVYANTSCQLSYYQICDFQIQATLALTTIDRVMILSFILTDLSGQTMQTQIRLLLEEPPDHVLHCFQIFNTFCIMYMHKDFHNIQFNGEPMVVEAKKHLLCSIS